MSKDGETYWPTSEYAHDIETALAHLGQSGYSLDTTIWEDEFTRFDVWMTSEGHKLYTILDREEGTMYVLERIKLGAIGKPRPVPVEDDRRPA